MENPTEITKTSKAQRLPFGHFIKSLTEAVNLGQMALTQACTIFFLGVLTPNPMASAVSLGSQAMGNML